MCRAHEIHSEAAGSANGRVVLDVGIVCPQAASHRSNTSRKHLGVAEACVLTKCAHNMVEQRCRERGVFQPMIFESLGGVSAEAKKNIKSLKEVVALNIVIN